MSLGFIMAMADHGGAGTARAANAVRPSKVPDQLIALGIIDQGRQIDHLQRSHGQYRLMGDAGHCSNQTPPRKTIICHQTWVRWSQLLRQHPETQDEPLGIKDLKLPADRSFPSILPRKRKNPAQSKSLAPFDAG